MSTTPVARALAAQNISFRLFEHGGPVRSLEQAGAERNQRAEQVVRSLLFRLDGEVYVMVLVAGPAQVSWPALRRALQVSRITTATPEQVQAITGYPIGAVAPFGLPQPLRVLIDASVLAQDEVSLGSGVRSTAVILARDDLLKALGEVEVVRLTEG